MELSLTPSGHILMIKPDVALPDHASDSDSVYDNRIAQAFSESQSAGIIALSGGKSSSDWPLSWVFWRDFGTRYLLQRCQSQSTTERLTPLPSPDTSTLAHLHLSLPPMPGAEYCTPDLLAEIWSALDDWVLDAIARNQEGLSGFLLQHAPLWRQVGRVCFHLAENKQDNEFPFAFMSTYVPRLGKNARAQHLPLNQALREYAGTNNRETLLRLLEPVYEAGNRCSWVKELLESGDIYHPLAWTPDEAYLLLKAISITPLKSVKWESVKRSCSGRIGSLIDLLRGKLDHGVMEVVTDRKEGLFPLPGEMKFNCDCPDWAGMCKHVAAVLYGVGARLDNSPEMLFVLRGVNHEELVDVTAAITDVAKSGSSRRRIASSGISDVFGIEIADAVPSIEPSVRPAKNIRADKIVVKGTSAKKPLAFPEPLTGDAIRAWRLALGETQAAFAARFKVSGATVSVWEKKGKAEVGMTAVTLALLRKAWQKNNKSDKMPML